MEITATIDQTTRQIAGYITNSREIALRNNGAAIQWQRLGDLTWTDLVQLDSLKPSSVIYVSNEQKTITNTNAEIDINDGTDYQGSRTIAANSVLKGDVFEIESEGILSTTGTPNTTVKIYWGSQLLLTSMEAMPNGLVSCFYGTKIKLRILSTGVNGTALLYGRIILQTSSGLAAAVIRKMASNTVVSINTTIANDLKATYQFSVASASNTLRIDGMMITKKRVNI